MTMTAPVDGIIHQQIHPVNSRSFALLEWLKKLFPWISKDSSNCHKAHYSLCRSFSVSRGGLSDERQRANGVDCKNNWGIASKNKTHTALSLRSVKAQKITTWLLQKQQENVRILV